MHMNHSIKTLVIATAFFASLALAAQAEAAPQLRVKNTGGSFAASVRAEPGETLEFQMFGNNTSAGSFSITLPADLTYVSSTFSNPSATTSASGQTVSWNFNTNSNAVIRFTATVASGSSLSTNHTLNLTFTTDTAATSDTATVTTGPIVTSVTPSSNANTSAVSISIAGHGFTGTSAVALSDGTALDLTGATITDTSISGGNLKIPALQAVGAYWVLVTVTASGNTLTTNADATETVRYTVTDGVPPTMSTGSNSYNHTTGVLTLNFNETIDVSATDKSKITLADASSGGNSLTLATATVSATDSTTVTFTLAQADINTISTWGQSANTLYVHIAGSGIFDLSANPLSNQGSRTALDTWTKDTSQPTATVTYTQNSATVTSAKTGALTITVTFNEPIATTPKIAINQQGTTDIAATDLTLSGSSRTTWTYAYTVNQEDGAAYVDGTATITVSNATDYTNLSLASTSNGTFTIDTATPGPAISTLAGAATGQTSATWSWTPTYTASDFSAYKFYWGTASGVTSANGTLVSIAGASTNSYALSGLSAGTNYYGVIYICDAAGNCYAVSNQATVQTQQNAVIAPPPSSGGGGGGGTPAPSTTSSSRSISSSGGTLTTTLSSGASATVSADAGTFSANTTITVSETTASEQASAPLSSSVGSFVGNGLFKLEATSGGLAVTSFSSPVTLTFGYTATQLGARDATTLRVAYFNTATGAWIALPSIVNAASRTVTADTTHFTLFAIISFSGTPTTETTPPSADSGEIAGSRVGAYPNGTLLKAPSAPAVWHIADGKKHLIRSAAIFESRFNWDDIIALPSTRQLDLYEEGSEVTFAGGALVKIAGEPAVYRVATSGGIAPIVSEEVFLGRGYRFGDVVEVEAGLLADYARLAAVTDAETLYSGDLVKLAGNPAVYYVEDGAGRLIPSSDIFHQNAFKFKNVWTISTAAFAVLSSGSPFTYPDGTLVKGEGSAVYVVADGAKRPILSALDFEALLYDWSEIRYVPETILAAIPAGGSIRLVSEGVNLAGE